jgi:hypothetical protein
MQFDCQPQGGEELLARVKHNALRNRQVSGDEPRTRRKLKTRQESRLLTPWLVQARERVNAAEPR